MVSRGGFVDIRLLVDLVLVLLLLLFFFVVTIRPSVKIHGDLNARNAFCMGGNLNARNPT